MTLLLRVFQAAAVGPWTVSYPFPNSAKTTEAQTPAFELSRPQVQLSASPLSSLCPTGLLAYSGGRGLLLLSQAALHIRSKCPPAWSAFSIPLV